jgi:hypothetical protein
MFCVLFIGEKNLCGGRYGTRKCFKYLNNYFARRRVKKCFVLIFVRLNFALFGLKSTIVLNLYVKKIIKI